MGELLAIARRDKKRATMQTLKSADITLHHGVAMDFRGKPSPRQVTVLSQESWLAACDTLNTQLPWTTRRANLLVKGLELKNSQGRTLIIGAVKLLITQETDPCERMNEALPGLYHALASDWRGGVCCRVLHEGRIQLGDDVEID